MPQRRAPIHSLHHRIEISFCRTSLHKNCLDSRLLASALVIDSIGILVFLSVYQFATSQSSLPEFSTVAGDAIIAFGLFVSVGFLLSFAGLIRQRTMTRNQAVVAALGSFALGAFSLFSALTISILYQDDLAACGGFPPGYWTTGNVTVNRCSIFYSFHQDWVSDVFWTIVLASAVIFLATLAGYRLTRSTLESSRSNQARSDEVRIYESGPEGGASLPSEKVYLLQGQSSLTVPFALELDHVIGAKSVEVIYCCRCARYF